MNYLDPAVSFLIDLTVFGHFNNLREIIIYNALLSRKDFFVEKINNSIEMK